MVRFNLQEIFLIQYFTNSSWARVKDMRNPLQIIFIEKGNGDHTINGKRFPYKKKDIFLIAKGDEYTFEMKKESVFCVFQFTDWLFSNRIDLPDRPHWLHRIDLILHRPAIKPGYAIQNSREQQLIWRIHDLITEEYEREREYYKDIIAKMVSTSLSIIARNTTGGTAPVATKKKESETTIDDILSYIHRYAHIPSKMKITALAETFKMTNSALSNIFKNKMDQSIHHYILLHKLDLVKRRLRNTEFTVSQIAHQLGFTDESHLTRIFLKYFNVKPKEFREAQ